MGYTPYCYLIGWSKINKWYYGSRFTIKKCANPSDLFATYKTSSKVVHDYIAKYGNPDIVEVRKTFKDAESALKWEQTVLRRIKAKYNQNWLNKCDGSGQQFNKHVTTKTKNSCHYLNLEKKILCMEKDIQMNGKIQCLNV